jgi:hypothetical protein
MNLDNLNYYHIIILLLLCLLFLNKMEKDSKIVEKNENVENDKQEILDLKILEEKNKDELEKLGREEQKVFFPKENEKTKMQVELNEYVNSYVGF